MLKDYSLNQFEKTSENKSLDEKSSFVCVVDEKGNEKIVRKSSVCWLLSKDKHKLSSDRLVRVAERDYSVNTFGIVFFVDADCSANFYLLFSSIRKK